LLRRARLTGSFDDLAAADAAVTQGLADAPPGAGPLLTGAIAAMAVHRLAPVDALLQQFNAAAVPNDIGDRAEAAALRGDLAFYSGRYDDAAAAYTRSKALENGGGAAVREAVLLRSRGDLAAADAALRRALGPNPGRQGHATILLQRGGIALAAGRWADAAALFAQADTVFHGWWLVAAHRAQMLAVKDDLAGADRAYRAIIGRTAQADPVVMDALAALCFERGDLAEGRVWAAQAGAIWDQRLLLLPEASYAHAAEHELAVGDPVKALDLARKNVAARPYGDAQLLLATAQLANGDATAAAATIEALNASGWRTAAQYVVLADALALLDRGAESDAARATAQAINPHALDAATSLLWFGAH
jgi:tetratricopeptide (TPR) repeat protein